jgi:hypothetical protein
VTDQPPAAAPTSAQPPPATPYPPSWDAHDAAGPAAVVDERPEIAAGAAFAAGFLFAMILKRIAR